MRKKVTIKNNKIIASEGDLNQQVVNYLKLAYPKVLFRTDFAAGIKMTIGQAVRHKKLQRCKAWPDLFIAVHKHDWCGLFIEIKKSKDEIFLKSGEFKKDKHISEQLEILNQLIDAGYKARFGCGFNEIKRIIDDYLNNTNERS